MRLYKINGKKYPSVTTVLSYSKPKSSVEALDRWKDRIGHEAATERFLEACDRGTKAHKLSEQFLLGEDLDYLGNERGVPYFESMLPVLKQITDLQLSEQKIHHTKLEYAGTLDCYATFRGVENTLIDFKTADKPKDIKWIADYFMQTTAYSACVYDVFGLKTNQAAIIIGLPNQSAQTFVLSREMMLQYWELWLERLSIFKSRNLQNAS